MKKLLPLVLSLLLATVAWANSAKYADISETELKAAIANKSAVILDANGSDSYKTGHIPGAIDFAAHKSQLASLLPADKHALVVAYCGGPQCVAYAEAAKAAVALGYTNVKHFTPGISGWVKSGAPVEKN
ncbi:MAG: rhodanese-like domain-containing protein [Opitutales bacterium]